MLLAGFEFLVGMYGYTLPLLCFYDCSLAECDVNRDWPEATRNVLEHANLLLEGYFEPYMPPYMLLRSGIVQRRCSHSADSWPRFFLFSYPL